MIKSFKSGKVLKKVLSLCHFSHFFMILLLLICSNSNAKEQNEEVIGTYGEWLKVCETETLNCVGVSFAENEQGTKVARFVIQITDIMPNKISAIGKLLIPYKFSLPHLPSGSILQIDQNPPIKEQFLFCDLNGCTVNFMFTELGLNKLSLGANLLIKIKDVRNTSSIKTMDIPLDGLDELIASLNNN